MDARGFDSTTEPSVDAYLASETDLGLPDWGINPPDWAQSDALSEHPQDDRLTLHHVQALGTHNRYHIQPELPLVSWQYTHLPLDAQLGTQGVRQFELDVYYDADRRVFEVYHLFAVDQETTCDTLLLCLQTMKSWSDAHRGHHPFLVLMEIKGVQTEAQEIPLLRDLEERILSVWPWERLIYPDLITGGEGSLKDALAARGWPVLGTVRGRGLFVLHEGGRLRARYTKNGTSTAGRVLFPDAYGDTECPLAAFLSIYNPIGGREAIERSVRAGHLVRTRADADGVQALAMDYSQFESALASGAHFISTDFPFPGDEEQYGVVIPGGTPSRCNPLSAPDDCALCPWKIPIFFNSEAVASATEQDLLTLRTDRRCAHASISTCRPLELHLD